MPTVRTKLTPFWYEPEFQDEEGEKVKFQIRPLTQRDMVEIDEYCGTAGQLTRRAQYEAGVKAITAIRGLRDEEGNELRWPSCAPLVDRHLIAQVGFRAWIEQTGGDWEVEAAKIREKVNEALGLVGPDAPKAEQASESGDPEKN